MANCGTCSSFVPDKGMCLFWKQTIPSRSEQIPGESAVISKTAYPSVAAEDQACSHWMEKLEQSQEVQ